MLAHDPIEVQVVAELRLRVSRSAPGDLVEGTRRAVAAIDGVVAVDTIEISSLTPTLNDLAVDATVTATVRLAGVPEARLEVVRSVLLDGFGVARVDVLALEHRDNGDRC